MMATLKLSMPCWRWKESTLTLWTPKVLDVFFVSFCFCFVWCWGKKHVSNPDDAPFFDLVVIQFCSILFNFVQFCSILFNFVQFCSICLFDWFYNNLEALVGCVLTEACALWTRTAPYNNRKCALWTRTAPHFRPHFLLLYGGFLLK